MSHRVEVALRPGLPDAAGRSVERKIREHLGIPVSAVRTRQLYRIEADLEPEQVRLASRELFCDPVIQEHAVDASLPAEDFDFSVIVAFRPGVTDNVGRTAGAAVGELLGRRLRDDERCPRPPSTC